MRVDASFVIPSFNGKKHLERALDQLLDAAPEAEVIVVDVGSNDGSAELVESSYPSVTLIHRKNYGWGHATNRGIEVATRPIVAMMNSDIFVERPALEAMVSRLASRPGVGVVAPMLHLLDGTVQPLWGLLAPLLYPPRARMAKGPVDVPQLSGAMLMCKREVLDRIGGIDENHFFYNEEWDWCRRVRQAGYRLELLRDQSVLHVGGGSTPRKPEFLLEQWRGFLYYLEKHHPGLLADATRMSMAVHGRVFSHIDPRADHREMWGKLAVIAGEKRLLDSPFPLSGRGVPTFLSHRDDEQVDSSEQEEAPPKSSRRIAIGNDLGLSAEAVTR